MPAMYGSREFIEAGGLMAYQADMGEAGRRVADDVHQILNGAKPADIPIYQATKFEFLINLKAAKALGLDGEVEAAPEPTRTTRSRSKSDVVNESASEPTKARQRRPRSRVAPPQSEPVPTPTADA